MHILLLLLLKFMTVMANLQESFSAEILGESLNGKETGVIALEDGLSKPNNKSVLCKKMMELFGFNLTNIFNALEIQ
jgi:DNA-binding XRE family transcriptional regulator